MNISHSQTSSDSEIRRPLIIEEQQALQTPSTNLVISVKILTQTELIMTET